MNLLLLSLYFPPLNTIAAQRAFAFYSSLTKNGHKVYVVTRFYDEEQTKGNNMLLGMQAPKNYNLQELETLPNVIYTRFSEHSFQKKIFNLLPPGVKGIYNILSGDVFHSGWIPFVKDTIGKQFKDVKFDCIIGTYGPPVILKLTSEISKKLQTPFIIDFRDIYIDERDSGYILFFKKLAQKKFLKNAKALLFVSEGMKNYFYKNASFTEKDLPSACIYNGYDPAELKSEISDSNIEKQFLAIKEKFDLVFLHTGTLYPGQNISFFLNGLNAQKTGLEIASVFIGLSKDYEIETEKNVFVLGRVSQAMSCRLQSMADALILPVWDGRYTGFSGKLPEYLYSGTPVICGPGPQADLLPFFDKSGNVSVCNDINELEKFILKLNSKEITPKIPENREYFTRDYWMQKLNDFLLIIFK